MSPSGDGVIAATEVATLQEQVSGEEKLKAAFEEFKQYKDSRVEQRCAEMDARLDALSIDFNEELYPHILTAIAGRRQVFEDVVSAGIAKGMSKGLRHRIEHRHAQLYLETIEAYDPEAKDKYIATLQGLKYLKYPLVDQLEGLKDAPMDVIMAAMYLESDTGDDVPQRVRDLHPSSSQLTIPVYPEVRDPINPWATQEEQWTLFTNGSSCVDGLGAWLILTSPDGVEFIYALSNDDRGRRTDLDDTFCGLLKRRSSPRRQEGGKQAPP
nr:reverse transcriptase domain-containing protein [Tanacetum cinerariifolium]